MRGLLSRLQLGEEPEASDLPFHASEVFQVPPIFICCCFLVNKIQALTEGLDC